MRPEKDNEGRWVVWIDAQDAYLFAFRAKGGYGVGFSLRRDAKAALDAGRFLLDRGVLIPRAPWVR
jgi:hypothetical protein